MSVLPIFVHAFKYLQTSDDIVVRNMAEIGRRAGFKDWEAPALYLTREKSKISDYKQVVREISAIIVFLALTKASDGLRAGRFGRMIADFESLISGKLRTNELESLKINNLDWQLFENSLTSDAYSIRGLRAGLLWLDWITGDDDRSVESSEITIEHVLPRKPGDETF